MDCATLPDDAAQPVWHGQSALQVLRQVFGYADFRGPQQDIIQHVVDGGDALVLMPTGGGKSLCYQIPALVRPGMGVVVSPLIALMRDQVMALRQAGVRAAYLNSSLDWSAIRQVEQDAVAGRLDLLYVAPERLVTPRFLELLDRCQLALFALDEAHCVSQWGHDFRPEYRQLAVLHERYPTVPRIALTATADTRTRADIANELGLTQARRFVSSFDRPNITYRVVPKERERHQVLQLIRRRPDDSGIVYCLSRAKVEDVAAWLAQQGVEALPYHAGLDPAVRQANQDRFLRGEGVVMVATVAFGMGIDKPNIRFVAHLDAPRSLEAYYQETGRAGRDGLPAEALLLFGLADVIAMRQMVEAGDGPAEFKQGERRKLDALLGFCETAHCRRQTVLAYFGETYADRCGNCDICLDGVATWDATVAAQKALSAVWRTGQRYGVAYLIDVLRGTTTDKIRDNGHDKVKTFGVGADLDKDSWQTLFRQLLALYYLTPDAEGYGGLMLTERAAGLLRGEESLHLRRRDRRDPIRQATRRPTGTVVLSDRDDELMRALKAARLELARAQGVPPYAIFHDSTLLEMVRSRPHDLSAMLRLPGVGQVKLDRYGDAFLAVIADQTASALPAA